MPRPNGNALPHDPRPSPGTLTSQYRQPTPWHAWVGPNRHATGASLHTAKTGNEAHHCGDSRLRTFTIHLARTPAGRVLARQRSGSAQEHSAARQGQRRWESLQLRACCLRHRTRSIARLVCDSEGCRAAAMQERPAQATVGGRPALLVVEVLKGGGFRGDDAERESKGARGVVTADGGNAPLGLGPAVSPPPVPHAPAQLPLSQTTQTHPTPPSLAASIHS